MRLTHACIGMLCLTFLPVAAEVQDSFRIPTSWQLIYEIRPRGDANSGSAQSSGTQFSTEIAAADIVGHFVAFEERTWRLEPRLFPARAMHPPDRTVHVLNVRTGEHYEAKLDSREFLGSPHFLGQDGLVVTGSHILSDGLRENIATPVPLEGAQVRRFDPKHFVVSGNEYVYLLDLSGRAEGRANTQILAQPESPLAIADWGVRVGNDFIAGWSRLSSPYDVVLVSRETGEVVWRDQARDHVLGLGDKHAYMWSYRIERGRFQHVLVRKAIKEPYRAESMDVPWLGHTPGVIDFCWPNLMVLVQEGGTGKLYVVNVDLKQARVQAGVDIGDGVRVLERWGSPELADDKTQRKWRLVGDSREGQLIIASGSAMYRVPLSADRDYRWASWEWKPYSFEDSK